MRAFLREIRDYLHLLQESEDHRIQFLFYAERELDYQYYADLIAALQQRGAALIHYVTSDPKDRLLTTPPAGVRAFYIKTSLPTLLANLKAGVVVMTMPDLHNFHLKRSPHVGCYTYVFHAVASAHPTLRFGALDHYDAVFCVGPYNLPEIRRLEEMAGRPPKRLVEYGYPWLETIHKRFEAATPATEPLVLVASTWGHDSILGLCPDIAAVLSRVPFRCVIRPHPEYVKREPRAHQLLCKQVAQYRNLSVELDLSSQASVLAADVLLVDSSGIGYEYGLGTERPVLFLDVPIRIENSRFAEVGIESIDAAIRSRIGKVVSLADLEDMPALVEELRRDRPQWRERIVAARSDYVFNWLRSAEVGADALMELAATTSPGSAAPGGR